MKFTKAEIKKAITGKLTRHYGVEIDNASEEQVFKACALVVRDVLGDRMMKIQNDVDGKNPRQVHYLSIEFLLGRSLEINCLNLKMLDQMRAALTDLGVDADHIFKTEPDPGLGNGGLGRLAACFMDSMASTDVVANGYTIRYAQGLFKQKIVDGHQVELPDTWLDRGDIWMIPAANEAKEVRFGGTVSEEMIDGRMQPVYHDYTTVLAVPYDLPMSGYDTQNIARLRLWESKSPVALDMSLFSQGKYLHALEEQAMAEVISMVLYPENNHLEGQALRLKQQYFLVSATIQDITQKHKAKYGTLKNFAIKNVFQINDTHPALAILELMRILMDEEGYGWDMAWGITGQSFAYTNHTVLPEALECWSVDLMRSIVPRLLSIVVEINRRFCKQVMDRFPDDEAKVQKLSIISHNFVKMANLSIVSSFSVNGVSALHSEILKDDLFHDFYDMYPARFRNVTNGIAHRRWMCLANEELSDFVTELIGKGFKTCPSELMVLKKFADDKQVLDKLFEIKHHNKERLAAYIKEHNGITVNTDSIFDVQVKRIHEYKRQMLNALHIVYLYQRLLEDPTFDMQPHTFVFGAKAAPGYYTAKRIINLLNSLAYEINSNPKIGDKLKVVFIEDYNVSKAEIIIPACEISEQISTAGQEASGTGNMKFMLNGAITLGTLDGANVEIAEAVGEENIFIFGKTTEEVNHILSNGLYNTTELYNSVPAIQMVLKKLNAGFTDGKSYGDLVNILMNGSSGHGDKYLVLGDFVNYINAHERANTLYGHQDNWQCCSLMNIASSGRFAADRAISDYAHNIWKVPVKFTM
ncbi:MAG: glycogen/starch/alpha-glucan phosphorylase [Eubacteriales bacterium]